MKQNAIFGEGKTANIAVNFTCMKHGFPLNITPLAIRVFGSTKIMDFS
jgi:hypothetical protein